MWDHNLKHGRKINNHLGLPAIFAEYPAPLSGLRRCAGKFPMFEIWVRLTISDPGGQRFLLLRSTNPPL
jgi:hypothetical protein